MQYPNPLLETHLLLEGPVTIDQADRRITDQVINTGIYRLQEFEIKVLRLAIGRAESHGTDEAKDWVRIRLQEMYFNLHRLFLDLDHYQPEIPRFKGYCAQLLGELNLIANIIDELKTRKLMDQIHREFNEMISRQRRFAADG